MGTITTADKRTSWPRWAPAAFMAGDVLLFVLFTVLGRREHHLAITLVGTLETAVPLTTSWLVVGLLGGVFRPETHTNRKRFAARLAVSWLIACALGIFSRARFLDMPIAWNFALITFGLMLVLLAIWHGILMALLQRRQATGSPST